MTEPLPRQTRSARWWLGPSLVVYVVWGSTYLVIRYGLEVPPFLMNGGRLLVAGAALYPIALRRGGTTRRREWRNAAFTGTILFIGGLGFVTIAEDNGVGSGLVASACCGHAALGRVWSGPSALAEPVGGAGLAVGLGGVVLLSREGDFQGSTLGTVLMVLSPILWAFGSVISSRVRLPKGLMASAAQMLGGGLSLTVVGFIRGGSRRHSQSQGVGSRWRTCSVGSLIAYTAYAYLLANTRPRRCDLIRLRESGRCGRARGESWVTK